MRFLLFILLFIISIKAITQIPPDNSLLKGKVLSIFEVRQLDNNQPFYRWCDNEGRMNFTGTLQEIFAYYHFIFYHYLNPQGIISNAPSKLKMPLHIKFSGIGFDSFSKEIQTHLKFRIIDTLVEQELWLISRGKTIKVDTIPINRYLGGGFSPENLTTGNDLICGECSMEQLAFLIEQHCGSCFTKSDSTVNFMYYNKFKIPEKVLKADFNTLNNYLKEKTGFFMIKRREKVPMVYLEFMQQ